VLKFRGYLVKRGHQPSNPPVDSDFTPKFEQKGVDMRIGLDMATIAANRSVDLIAVMTNDTDCVPAMKLVRRAGIQIALVCIPDATLRLNSWCMLISSGRFPGRSTHCRAGEPILRRKVNCATV